MVIQQLLVEAGTTDHGHELGLQSRVSAFEF
jgi:hypothetical protein